MHGITRACSTMTALPRGEEMPYNRMEDKPIAGAHCRLCGDAKALLAKMPCCAQWMCCD
jgi:hypothetical protein